MNNPSYVILASLILNSDDEIWSHINIKPANKFNYYNTVNRMMNAPSYVPVWTCSQAVKTKFNPITMTNVFQTGVPPAGIQTSLTLNSRAVSEKTNVNISGPLGSLPISC